ncbi:hypothetical protein EDP1_3965 [Pseudomonas putida S610]|nr:hypothetical protein EDP1_3965 [Pseudomonas putida S610]
MNLSSESLGCRPEKTKPPIGGPTGGLSILMFGGPSKVDAVWVSAPSG